MEIPKDILATVQEQLRTATTYNDLMGKEGAIKTLLKYSLEQLLEMELTHHLGYEKHHPDGKGSGNSRNGSSRKTLASQLGNLQLDIPRDRTSDFEPIIVPKHQRTLGQLEDAIISMYAKGMSTRDIQSHVEDIYGVQLSPSAVSTITDQVIDLVHQWQQRPLDPCYPIVFLDAIHYKVKQENKVITKAIYSVLAIDVQGKRDVLGLWMSEHEGATFWLSVLSELRSRGVQELLIACVDGLKGFPDAIATVFPKTETQQCIIHQIRQSFRYVAHKHAKEFAAELRTVYTALNEEAALRALEVVEEQWMTKYPLAVKSWRANWHHLATFFRYPQEIRTMIYTTNAVESLHRQYRKVTKAKSLFPNDDAIFKMLFLVLRDRQKTWTKPVRDWALIVSQLSLIFDHRITNYL